MGRAETPVEKSIMKTIVSNNGFVIKNQASPTTGRGRPDLSACINGRYIAIEVKRTDQKSTTNFSQFNQLVNIAKAGGIALYVTDADAFEKYYTQLDKPCDELTILDPSSVKVFIAQLNQHIHNHKIIRITCHGQLEVIV